jgi:hypothetical protein
MALKLSGIQIPVKGQKVNIYRIQNQLNRHQNGNDVLAGNKSVNTDKKHERTGNEKKF